MASRQSPRWATLIPNATCALASDRASATAGEADSVDNGNQDRKTSDHQGTHDQYSYRVARTQDI